MTLGPIGKQIEGQLRNALSPTFLDVIDESAAHHGHAGAHADGESHFRIRIAAPALSAKSRIEQHRAVNSALAELLRTRVHALAIEVVR